MSSPFLRSTNFLWLSVYVIFNVFNENIASIFVYSVCSTIIIIIMKWRNLTKWFNEDVLFMLSHLYVPLQGNSVWIFFTPLERLEIFKLNFEALIQVSTETFSDPYNQIVITKYCTLFTNVLRRNEVETLAKLFDKWSWTMILSTWSYGFLKKLILVCKLNTVLSLRFTCPNFVTL